MSLVSYVRSVALLGLKDSEGWTLPDQVENRQRVKARCDEYAEALIPEVVRTRHKIGAHFAATAPRREDNVGMLEASLLQPVMYKRPYFWAGSYWQGTTPEEQVEEHAWALTEAFERLAPRYWPNQKLPPLPTGEG